MSRTKKEHNPLSQERFNFLKELNKFRKTKFMYLKQPEFAQIDLKGVKGLSSAKTVQANLGLEINEAKQLWFQINTIFKELESEFNEISDEVEDRDERVKQKSGELQRFLAEHLSRYSALQQKVALPDSQQFERYNFSELTSLKESRDFIAKAYKLHWLSVVHNELNKEKRFNPGSNIENNLKFLQKKLEEWPLDFFLDEQKMTSLASRLQELQDQRVYNNLCQFYHIQEIALGRKSQMDPFEQDNSAVEPAKKMEVIQQKINANIKRSSAPLNLDIPADILAVYNRNKAFIKGMGLVLNTGLNFEGDQLLIQNLSDPSWLGQLEDEFRNVLFTEPANDEICTGLLARVGQFYETTQSLRRFHEKLQNLDKKRQEILDGHLAIYPSYVSSASSKFFGEVDRWRQIRIALQSWPEHGGNELADRLKEQDIDGALKRYQEHRVILIRAKNEGFDPEVNYKDILQALEDNKEILDATLDFNVSEIEECKPDEPVNTSSSQV